MNNNNFFVKEITRGIIALVTVLGGGVLMLNGDGNLQTAVVGIITLVIAYYFRPSNANEENDEEKLAKG